MKGNKHTHTHTHTRHSDGQNRKQIEIIQGKGKTECDRVGRKENDKDGAAYEEERRR